MSKLTDYMATRRIRHNGKMYQDGATISLSEEDAVALRASGAIKEKVIQPPAKSSDLKLEKVDEEGSPEAAKPKATPKKQAATRKKAAPEKTVATRKKAAPKAASKTEEKPVEEVVVEPAVEAVEQAEASSETVEASAEVDS